MFFVLLINQSFCVTLATPPLLAINQQHQIRSVYFIIYFMGFSVIV